MQQASPRALCKMASWFYIACSAYETQLWKAIPETQQYSSVHHLLDPHHYLVKPHQTPQPLEKPTTLLCIDHMCRHPFGLAWLVRQLRACCHCISMVQYYDTAGAWGWGKASQMLQAPRLRWEARPSCWKSLSGIDFSSRQTASNKLCCISKCSNDLSARQTCFLKVDPPTLHPFPHSRHSSISLGLHLEYLLMCLL